MITNQHVSKIYPSVSSSNPNTRSIFRLAVSISCSSLILGSNTPDAPERKGTNVKTYKINFKMSSISTNRLQNGPEFSSETGAYKIKSDKNLEALTVFYSLLFIFCRYQSKVLYVPSSMT